MTIVTFSYSTGTDEHGDYIVMEGKRWYAQAAIAAAVAEEREACAVIAQDRDDLSRSGNDTSQDIAAEIRARGSPMTYDLIRRKTGTNEIHDAIARALEVRHD